MFGGGVGCWEVIWFWRLLVLFFGSGWRRFMVVFFMWAMLLGVSGSLSVVFFDDGELFGDGYFVFSCWKGEIYTVACFVVVMIFI